MRIPFASIKPSANRTQLTRAESPQASPRGVVVLGSAVRLTRGGPDGQWLDGNTGTNPMRFKK